MGRRQYRRAEGRAQINNSSLRRTDALHLYSGVSTDGVQLAKSLAGTTLGGMEIAHNRTPPEGYHRTRGKGDLSRSRAELETSKSILLGPSRKGFPMG